MISVYILQSLANNHYYIGHTANLDRRLKEHNCGNTISTRNKGLWVLVYKEEYPSKSEAYQRELKIKSYKGGEAFKRLTKMGA